MFFNKKLIKYHLKVTVFTIRLLYKKFLKDEVKGMEGVEIPQLLPWKEIKKPIV